MPTLKKKSQAVKDPDLLDPQHDQMMQWLDDRAEALTRTILDLPTPVQWNPQYVRALQTRAQTAVLAARTEFGQRGYLLDKLIVWQGLTLPAPVPVQLKKEWQVPVPCGRTKLYVDIQVTAQYAILVLKGLTLDKLQPSLQSLQTPIEPPWLESPAVTAQIHFHVELQIESLGAYLRQLRACPVYTAKNIHPYVVSSDVRFLRSLNAQGIGLVRYPDGKIFLPDRV